MNKEIRSYLSGLSANRLKRLEDIRKAFLNSDTDVVESIRYKMPSFEKDGNWVALASQKNYVSVYFCSEPLIENIRGKHPAMNTGKGCVRIRATQDVPLDDLLVSFRKAMNQEKTI